MWIESHQALRNHPKLSRLRGNLSLSKAEAIGHLHCLWWWAVDYAPMGSLKPFSPQEIADGAEWQGDPDKLVAALREAGWIDKDGSLHDWDEYCGRLIEKKAQDAERKRTSRAQAKDVRGTSTGQDADVRVTAQVPDLDLTEPDKPKAEKLAPNTPAHALYLALCAACGMNPDEQTKRAKRAGGIAANEILAAGGTPEQVPERAVNYRAHFGDAALTPSALASHWAQMARPPNGRPRHYKPGERSLELAEQLRAAEEAKRNGGTRSDEAGGILGSGLHP